jgi:bifunctional non-homologous end joining protein LigD
VAEDVTLRVGRRRVPISHPAKRLFADPPVTKLDLARYYERVAPVMLPHLKDRPLALQAFPAGIERHGFFLKSIPKHFPDWIATATVPKRGGSLTQVLAHEAATLVYLAGQNVITPHIWLSRADLPREPDRLTVDLDPAPGVGFAEVRAAARAAGERLRDAGLTPYAMVTGSRGIHVVCPLRRGSSFSDVHGFARGLAEQMVAAPHPRMAPGRAGRAHLPGRQPHQLRPTRRGAVRRPPATGSTGGDADRMGRAIERALETGPVGFGRRGRPGQPSRRRLAGHRAAGQEAPHGVCVASLRGSA